MHYPNASLAAIGKSRGWQTITPKRPYSNKLGDMLCGTRHGSRRGIVAVHVALKREYEFASQSMQRLLRSAEEIVFSYPRMDGDREMGPSPLILSFPEKSIQYCEPRTFRRVIHESAKFEEFIDEQGPPIPEHTAQRGGSRLRSVGSTPGAKHASEKQ